MGYYYSNMKKLITLVCAFFIAVSAIAQVDYVDSSKREQKRSTFTDRVGVSITMGTGVGFSNLKSSPTFVSTYIAPSVNYALTSKFKLNFGLIHYNVSGSSFIDRRFGDNRFPTGNRMYSGNLLQLEGQYLVNEKTRVSGGILYNVNPLSTAKNNYKGATIGIDYKVTPHTTFSVRTTIIQGKGSTYSPYSNNPFVGNPLTQPLFFNTSNF